MDLARVFTIEPDPSAVANRVAQIIAEAARAAIGTRGKFTLALTGGSSPLGLYDRLAGGDFRDRLDWGRVHWFWGDERAVAPDDPRSNYGVANQRLLQKIPVAPDDVHRMEAERSDLENAACEYESVLRTVAGPGMNLDVILLGIGTDGHIFSLYPGCPQIVVPTAPVVALRKPPMDPALDRVTFTPLVLAAARQVIVFAHGEGKSRALAGLLDPAKSESEVPAKMVARVGDRVSIVVDRAAAGHPTG
jgi:6-phosphogluconolactonase